MTYVLPKNLLKQLISSSDLRTQCGGYIYGVTPEDAPMVREVRAIALPPQVGSHTGVTFPRQPPTHEALAGLQPLGWIHTQPAELPHLSPTDVLAHVKLLEGSVGSGAGWDGEQSVVLTVSFTPGSASLACHRVTPTGLQWARAALKDGGQAATSAAGGAGYIPNQMVEKGQLLLSDRFTGFFLTPAPDGVWNYAFMGVRHTPGMAYTLALAGPPRPFYDERHRPAHFLNFAGAESGPVGGAEGGAGPGGAAGVGVDREDVFK